MTVRLFLAKGREKSLLRRHPWVFSGAVQRVEGKALSGETIDILDSQGSGWRAAPIRPSRRSAHASGPSRKMKRLTSISSFAACSKHKAGAMGRAARRSGRIPSDRRRVRRHAGYHYRSLPEFPGAAAAVRRCRIPAPGPAFRPATLLPGMFDLRSLRRCGAQKKACRWRRARCWAICRRNCCRSPNTA